MVETEPAIAARERLLRLPPGRHYGSSADSDCWAMVGRDLTTVSEWSIVPPAASVTYVWDEGRCALSFEGGKLAMGPGDWMWIDAGFAHRGVNTPGSNFLTVFIPAGAVRAAALDIAPIGAAAGRAPDSLAALLTRLAVMLLDGAPTGAAQAPILDAVLDFIGTDFAPHAAIGEDEAVARAAALLREGLDGTGSIAEVAEAVGLKPHALSRQFVKRIRLTPVAYRRQCRLALATRLLADGRDVSQAAAEAGFADAAHLSRTFADQYGIPPSRWAQQVVHRPPRE